MIKQMINWAANQADKRIENMGCKDVCTQDLVNGKIDEMLKPHLSIDEQVEEIRKAVRSGLELK